MFQKILAPVDGSEQSGRAIDVAVDLAGRYGGTVMILCVYRHHSPLEASLSMVRAVQPKMKAIQAKYKDKTSKDAKMKMQQETMALYRDHGVNPVGGCLPLVLQMPIFIGLYQQDDRSFRRRPPKIPRRSVRPEGGAGRGRSHRLWGLGV